MEGYNNTIVIKKFFFSFLLFFLCIIPVRAESIPNGVNPEKGQASLVLKDQYDVKAIITFWNVGQLSGNGKYSQLVLTSDCSEAKVGDDKCIGHTYNGTFSGGPNGSVTLENGGDIKLQLVNGTYFDMSAGKKAWQIPVENPEIFNGWNNKVENKLEDSGAGFSDLAGQVEINIPRPDGTYDEENWTYAKLDGKRLPAGTHIKTSDKSTAIITFTDASQFIMKPESEIVLSDPTIKDGHIKILSGYLLANIKKMMKDGSMIVEMSQAVAGIKGTRFVLTENGRESKIEVTEGKVEFTHKTTKEKTFVSTGESVTADSVGFKPKTTFNPTDLDTEILNSKSEKIPARTFYIIITAGAILTIFVIGFVLIKKRKVGKN